MFDSDRSQYAEVERNARQLAESISRLIKNEKGHMSAEKREKMEHMKQQARDTYARTREGVQTKMQDVDKYAHENVWKTAAISAAVGAVLSSLLYAKKRNR